MYGRYLNNYHFSFSFYSRINQCVVILLHEVKKGRILSGVIGGPLVLGKDYQGLLPQGLLPLSLSLSLFQGKFYQGLLPQGLLPLSLSLSVFRLASPP